MSEVVVIARFKAKPGKESALENALRAAIDPTHMEAGCIRYALHRSLDDPGAYCFLERWRSRGDLEEHLQRGHVKTLFAKLHELSTGNPLIDVMEAVPDGQAEKGQI